MKNKRLTLVLILTLIATAIIPICTRIGNTRAADTDEHVVYWSMSGSDSNNGTTPSKPVKTLKKAFTILADYKSGGTVVVMDGIYNKTDGSLTSLEDAGGTVTITSSYGGVDYRENASDPARLCLHYGYSFNNDVVFDGIDFIQLPDSATDRVLYLNHNDLTINSNCGVYSYSGKIPSGGCPAKSSAVTYDATMIISTGYKATTLGTLPETIDQKIDIQSGAFKRIYVGNKYYVATSDQAISDTRLDSGTVRITIGANATVSEFIDATQDITTNINTYVELANTAVNVNFNDGIAAKDRVTIRKTGIFEINDSTLKMHDGFPAVLIHAAADVASIDGMNASEFGMIFTLYDGTESFFITDDVKFGKSYAYTSEENGYRNYNYTEGDENATFSGLLVYNIAELAEHADSVIIAYPYAVDGTTGYTVTGTPCIFNLSDVCELIAADESSTEEEKSTASNILNMIDQSNQLQETP